jgi:hypothetical protein
MTIENPELPCKLAIDQIKRGFEKRIPEGAFEKYALKIYFAFKNKKLWPRVPHER